MLRKKYVSTTIKIFMVVTIIAISLSGCIHNNKNRIAVKLLEDKYREEFAVKKNYGNDGWLSRGYKVIAYAKKHPGILFEAKVSSDGTYILDEYVASRVCQSVEQQIANNLNELPGVLKIKVEAVSSSIDSDKADMDIEEFMSIKTKNRFAVYLIYKPLEDKEELYQTLPRTFSQLECMAGNIQLYITDERGMKRVEKYLEERPKVDYEFEVALEHIEPITIPFEKGIIDL